MTLSWAVFAVSLAASVYIYFGYPALIFLVSRLRPRPFRRGGEPTVTVLIPVYNEEGMIEGKIANTLALDYPPDRLETLVVSDGSTDGTEAIVRRFASEAGDSVRLLSISRSGKAFALNEGARAARGEILVLTDANTLLEPGSLRPLVDPFADPGVGGVCGNKKQRPPAGADTTAEGENLYWRWDKWQKALESRAGSIFAADGTLYAVRKDLYVPIADPAQADDIAISARIVLQGRRLLYEPRAVAWEEAPAEGREEFRRKVRVTNHSVRALWNLGRGLWTSGFYSVELLSHKFFRHLVPFFLIPLFLSNAVLAASATGGSPVFRILFAGQVLFYGLALAGFALRGTRLGRAKPFTVPYYFCLVNAAAFLGVLSILRGRRLRAWTPRSGLSS
ncbi:MAG TPA: glycosyltransferase family 2 protein [Thermoanaerobaculia bacterium]|nr:glycosyltransferase family 2 protein [Thermoanaerobaculia bacterium]